MSGKITLHPDDYDAIVRVGEMWGGFKPFSCETCPLGAIAFADTGHPSHMYPGELGDDWTPRSANVLRAKARGLMQEYADEVMTKAGLSRDVTSPRMPASIFLQRAGIVRGTA
jgi:hypothetical protein